MTDVAQQLEELPHATQKRLRALWVEHYGKAPTFRASRTLLVLMLAYRLQEKAYGGLSKATRAKLLKIAQAVDKPGGKVPQARQAPRAGTRLLREWRGETHSVLIGEGGVEYRGKRYGSLSEVARVITGTRWSGPAFFGLRDAAREAA